MLYLDPGTGALTAYDQITLGGLGRTEVTIDRQLVTPALPTGGEGLGGDGVGGDGAAPGPTPTAPAPATPPAPASPTG